MLKEKERLVFEFIKESLENGNPPTVREICAKFNYRSTASAQHIIEKLIKYGYIEKQKTKSRTIKIVGQKSISVPLVGKVTAGQPITAIEDITEYISFSPKKNYSGQLFALRVSGESMINAGILDNDIIIAEKTSYVNNGEIAVIMVGEEATVKRFYKKDNQFILHPENDFMDDIIVDEAEIIGLVVGLIRYI